jgi:uncharacterized protein (TIRG00374 family)
VAGLLVAAALLVWVLHDVDWSQVGAHVLRADLGLLGAAVAAATATFLLRTWRWQLMLRNGAALPLTPLWHAVAIGFMANNLLPARAGEFARAWIVSRQVPLRMSTALASIAVERALDGLVVTGLLAVAVAAPSFPIAARVGNVELRHVATGLALLFSVVLLFGLAVVLRPAPWLAALRRVSHAVLPARLADGATRIAEGLVAGLTVLRTPGRLAGVVAWSVALWLMGAASFWLCLEAFHLDVPPEAALLIQGLIALSVAIPAAPGFFGVFEAVATVALGFYGVAKEPAVSYAIAYHVTTFLPITLLGLYSLSRQHVRLRDLRVARVEAAQQ